MPVRRPNLLDAFRKAHDVPGDPPSTPAGISPAAPRAPERAPASQGPVAAPAQPASAVEMPRARPPEPPQRVPPAGAAGQAGGPNVRVLVLALGAALVLLVAVIAYKLGSASGADPADTVHAAPPALAAPSAPPAAQPRADPAAAARTKPDQDLYDTQNRYSLRLIQYPSDERGLALATEAYRWLVQAGIPVASPIQLSGGKGLVLVAGAAPTRDELVPLRDYVRELRYPEGSKKKPFSDAYVDEIERVLVR